MPEAERRRRFTNSSCGVPLSHLLPRRNRLWGDEGGFEVVDVLFMNLNQDQIQQLHQLYQQLTGLSVPLTMGRIFTWEAWGSSGYTSEDLRVVVSFLRGKIKGGRKTIACLRFSTFIGNPDFFGEDLAEARAVGRHTPMPEAKEEVLRATGRPTEPEPKCRSAAEILAAEKAFEAFRALKESL